MSRSEFRFFERLRVRWAEVDLQKIVFNGHYLMYFDTAVAGYWRAMAMPYHETMAYLDGDLYVRKATLEYLGSARYDDNLEVGMRCSRIGNSSILFGAAVFRGETLLVSGELVYVFANPSTQTSLPVPAQLRALLQDFEAGKPMLDVRLGTWDELGREAQLIRTAVFVQEQQIPAEMEWDAADASCVHAVAYNRFGMALGTGRLAGTLAGRGQDRPHGRAAGPARRQGRPRTARHAGGLRAPARRARGAAACADERGRLLRPRRLHAARQPLRRGRHRRTWRWCAPCSGGAASGGQGVEHFDMPCAAQPGPQLCLPCAFDVPTQRLPGRSMRLRRLDA
jgi:YbgC/YbaW family acyl-CoA thioester hydrolase